MRNSGADAGSPARYPAKPIPKLRRWIYIGIGSLSLIIGMIALFVPVLPTTIFLIIASWFFVRSSPYLHHKLITHPVLGPPLHRFMVSRAMPRRAKVMSIATMWIGALTGYLITRNAHILVHAAIVVITMTGTFVILFCLKTTPSEDSPRSQPRALLRKRLRHNPDRGDTTDPRP